MGRGESIGSYGCEGQAVNRRQRRHEYAKIPGTAARRRYIQVISPLRIATSLSRVLLGTIVGRKSTNDVGG